MGKRTTSAAGKSLAAKKSQSSLSSATSTGVKTSSTSPATTSHPSSASSTDSKSSVSSPDSNAASTPPSSASSSAAAPSSHSTKSSSSTKPVHQNFHYAVLYSLILIGFVYIALFKGILLEDPVRSMTQTLPIIILIQFWYCLSGGLDAELAQVFLKRNSGGKDSAASSTTTKRRKVDISISASFSTALLATILSLIMSVLVFGLLILFGAPASTYLHETFLCAVHISVLSVQPLVYVYNLDSETWKDIISVKLPLNGVYGASVGAWVGAWLGAIPIPLDWDRPWQQWPITILAGSYIGTAVGTLVGATYRKFR